MPQDRISAVPGAQNRILNLPGQDSNSAQGVGQDPKSHRTGFQQCPGQQGLEQAGADDSGVSLGRTGMDLQRKELKIQTGEGTARIQQ